MPIFWLAGVSASAPSFAAETTASPTIARELRALIEQGNAAATVRAYNAWLLRGLSRPAGALPPIAYRDNDNPLFNLPGMQSVLPGRGLVRLLREQGYTAREIHSPLLEARDEAALARTLFMRAVARRITRGAGQDRDRAARLFAFVISEIQPRPQANDTAWPEDILIRGWGSCDQSAWVLARLAEQVGIKSLIVFLRQPQTATSYHTIVALHIDRRWHPFDTFAGLDFQTPNQPDLLAALVDPTPLRTFSQAGDGACLLNPAHLPWSDFLVYTEHPVTLLRWAQFRDTAGAGGKPFHFWVNPIWRMKILRYEMAKKLGGQERDLATLWKRFSTGKVENGKEIPAPQVRVFPYGEPFVVARRYASPTFLRQIMKTRAYGRFRTARRLHLLGNPRAALDIFDQALRPTAVENISQQADRLFYGALSALAAKQPRKALSLLSSLRKAPLSNNFWHSFLAWHEARAQVALKEFPTAEKSLRHVSEPRVKAAARWRAALPTK